MINAVVDLSHHNKVGSFAKLKDSGVIGVIQKATQGFTFKDPTYKSNRNGVLNAGMLFGAYHFGTAGDPAAQAEFFLSVAGDTELLVLDFEPNPQGQDMTLLEAEHFVHEIFAQRGRYPGLYSGHTVKEALLAAGINAPSQTELSKCWLWFARYGPPPLIPKVWEDWTLWQYTDGAAGDEPHTASGVGRCDRSKFQGTAQDLQSFWRGGD
jgi:lysozyme